MPHPGLPRRRLFEATLGAAAVSGTLTGFATIWAQNIREITLQHAGLPVTALPQIAEYAGRDLGFTIRMQASEGADLLNRFLSQSSTIDVADVSITYLKYLVGRNVLQTIPLSR
jgi:putative spermidine/putrescine transport system substrate-binding protein